MTDNAFRLERDMLEPLLARRETLARGLAVSHFLEVPSTTSGIPDVVLACLDEDAVSERQRLNLQPLDSVVLRACVGVVTQPGGSGASIGQLADACAISRSRLRRTVLPDLCDAGWIEPIGSTWFPTHAYVDAVEHISTIELKLKDWRRGLDQVLRHAGATDDAWLVIDRARSNPAIQHRDLFASLGIGLATLDASSGELEITVNPTSARRRDLYRSALGERLLRLRGLNRVSGTDRPMFGRNQASLATC